MTKAVAKVTNVSIQNIELMLRILGISRAVNCSMRPTCRNTPAITKADRRSQMMSLPSDW